MFELVNDGGGNYTPVTLLSFGYNGADGANPAGGLIADAAGDLFGTTGEGGAYTAPGLPGGTVFELVNNGGGSYTPVTLLSFNVTNGAGPVGGLIANTAGDLFGTTAGGGAAGDGTAFELSNVGFQLPSPTITGTVADQTTTSEAPIDPFSTVTIGDPNASATDTLSITFTAADGSLNGAGLTGSNGSYTLSGTAASITSELDKLVFTRVGGGPGFSETTAFTLSDSSSADATPAVDSTTSVIDGDPIATNGVTSLVKIASQYELESVASGTGPFVSYGGTAVIAGPSAVWEPVGAEQTATGGYEVAWKNTATNQYLIWNTDGNGDYTSSATATLLGTSYALEDLELSFGEDLNGDGTIGPTTTSIGTNGSLAQVANQYALESGGSIQAWVEYQGSPITASPSAVWAPVAAVETGNGYEVAWGDASANEYTVWNTDLNGDYTTSATGLLTASSPQLEAVEGYFGEQFPGGGTPTTPGTPTNGITPIGNLFELNPGGGTGPLLQDQGSVITSGEAWAPVGAVKTGNGYEVAWRDASANEYTV